MANENLESKRWLIAIAAVVINSSRDRVRMVGFKIPLNMHGWDGKQYS